MDITCLIADDEHDLRLLTHFVLTVQSGFHVVGHAPDGHAAVATWKRLEADGGCDVVIIDDHMPGYDGLTAAKVIKRSRPEQLVVLLSTSLAPGDEAAMGLDVDAVVSKWDVEALPDLLRGLVAWRRARAA